MISWNKQYGFYCDSDVVQLKIIKQLNQKCTLV